jgi:hypothetical protein
VFFDIVNAIYELRFTIYALMAGLKRRAAGRVHVCPKRRRRPMIGIIRFAAAVQIRHMQVVDVAVVSK